MLNPFEIKDPNYAYVIAEIGNNHQGSLNKAFELLEAAKWAGADAVKIQKRDNKTLFSPEFYNSPYDNPNSFGSTYGEHREAVELNKEQLKKLKTFSDKLGITIFGTPFDEKSLNDLNDLKMPFFKLASADLVNTPLISKIASIGKGIIVSTGHSSFEDLDRALNVIGNKCKVIILHCTAAYPAPIDSLNLNCITEFKNRYQHNLIGLSDHENGIDAASVAYMLGARVFEKHFTLNRAEKGTDNAFSLEPAGLQKLVRNLRRIPLMLGKSMKTPLNVEKNPIYKMRKSIVYSRNISKGEKLDSECFLFRCPGNGLPPYEIDQIIGAILTENVNEFQLFQKDHIKLK